ncbi:hypothetical protein LAUMK15_05728 [Mycobacterium persicum]|nr:hypothetical protein LAUMK15_05728 [Mycobacterium persicum]
MATLSRETTLTVPFASLPSSLSLLSLPVPSQTLPRLMVFVATPPGSLLSLLNSLFGSVRWIIAVRCAMAASVTQAHALLFSVIIVPSDPNVPPLSKHIKTPSCSLGLSLHARAEATKFGTLPGLKTSDAGWPSPNSHGVLGACKVTHFLVRSPHMRKIFGFIPPSFLPPTTKISFLPPQLSIFDNPTKNPKTQHAFHWCCQGWKRHSPLHHNPAQD